jgi:hypothetical protein
MDRSFLSRPEVVQASQNFICIRLATYESAAEAQLLKKIFVGGSGDLENTTFALLSPDGANLLARPGRGPHFAFQDAGHMAQAMDYWASRYRPKAQVAALPAVPDLRLALNLAACDGLPVVVGVAQTSAEWRSLERALAGWAWQPELRGRAIFALETSARARALLPGLPPGPGGVLVIAPGTYGLDGRVLARLGADDLASAVAAVRSYRPPLKDAREHIRRGHQQGIHWETAIPVTDPGPPRR